jgi:chaperone modulatory protein CbpM
MMRLEAVCVRVAVAPAELSDWIARGWVQPRGEAPDWWFADIDVARVRLVRDLRIDAGIEADSLALVLSLLDQVYGLQDAIRGVLDIVAEQPEAVRQAVGARLRREHQVADMLSDSRSGSK